MRFFELDGTISIQLVGNLKDIILIRLLYSIRFLITKLLKCDKNNIIYNIIKQFTKKINFFNRPSK